jgi:hypothetical protein
MAIMQVDIQAIRERAPDLAPEDATRLCKYGTLLATVARTRDDEELDDDMTPDELAEKAEQLLAGMRKARR